MNVLIDWILVIIAVGMILWEGCPMIRRNIRAWWKFQRRPSTKIRRGFDMLKDQEKF